MMSIPTQLEALAGRWQGTNHLWLDPNEPARESPAEAEFQMVAMGKFASLRYTWADEGQPQEGLLLVGLTNQQLEAVWVDSWHMQDKMMQLMGSPQADGSVKLVGAYAAPPGPDWGWRISILPLVDNQFQFVMHNISPEGEEMLAVKVVFSRIA